MRLPLQAIAARSLLAISIATSPLTPALLPPAYAAPPSAEAQAQLRKGFQAAQAGLSTSADSLLSKSISEWEKTKQPPDEIAAHAARVGGLAGSCRRSGGDESGARRHRIVERHVVGDRRADIANEHLVASRLAHLHLLRAPLLDRELRSLHTFQCGRARAAITAGKGLQAGCVCHGMSGDGGLGRQAEAVCCEPGL